MGRKRAIICFETEERFESVTDAANAIGATWPLVSNALKRHGACRGFHFYYADEAKPDDSVFDRKVNKNSRPIICLETNERFESQAKAAKAVGVPRAAIYAALRGHIATKGLHFYFADEPKPDEEFFRNRSWTRVRCKETGVVLILSRLVDTFFSRISPTMQLPPKHHSIAYVLPWAEGLHWQSRSSGCSNS